MQWTLFFFVFGIVLVARISIELGGGRATLYGSGLALAVWLALQAFIEYPAGSLLRPLSWIINLGLIAVAWWCAHQLTWDCTYIDENVDATGKGVLDAAGLDQPEEDETEEPESEEEERHERQSPGFFAWWDRYQRYRAEQLCKPHTPGVWVVYFSLAALPLFGLGQALIPAADAGRRNYVFWLMVCYVGSGLALLVTTSFLGLRRYLRQRKLKMPAAMTGMWMVLGGGLIVLLMAIAALVPRPYGEYSLFRLNSSETSQRNASRYAVLREGAGKGQGRASSDKGKQKEDAEPGSGKRKDEQGAPRAGKGTGGKSGQGKSGGKQGDQAGAAKSGDSGRQDRSPNDSRSGNKSDTQAKGGANDPQPNRANADRKNGRQEADNRRTGGEKSDTGQSSDSTRSLPQRPVFEMLQNLGKLGVVLKWVIFTLLALVALFLILRSGLNFLANFTNWARRLLDAFHAWWEGLFGRDESESEEESEETVRLPTPRPFASFTNPFLDGRAEQLSPDALTRYSFEALQAWAWEQGVGRRRAETPLEFAERLGTDRPRMETEIRSLAGLYARLAYARSSLTPACLGLLKQFWQRLEAIEEKPLSV
jgi:hypothetical protein